MNLSTHYYVLALSDDTTRLYEAFRGQLIDIMNTWFPLASATRAPPQGRTDEALHALLQKVDRHFAHYYGQDPLNLVLVGTPRIRSAFAALTDHSRMIIGHSDGDYATTSPEVLGTVVWPIVMGAMATAGHGVAHTLDEAARMDNIAIGLDAVVHSLDAGIGATLVVEEDYRVSPRAIASLLEDCDNVVDVVVDRVLALGGNVVFVDDGSLAPYKRIALVLRSPVNHFAHPGESRNEGLRGGDDASPSDYR